MMVRCPKCGTRNDDQNLVCRSCNSLLDVERTQLPAGASEREDAGEARGGAGAPDPAVAGRMEGAAGDGDLGTLRASFDLPGTEARRSGGGRPPDEAARTADRQEGTAPRTDRQAAAGSPSSPGAPAEPTVPPPPPSPPSSSRQDSAQTGARRVATAADLDLDPSHLAAITHHGKGRPLISVIGFPGSGKSFLVNRLRYELARRGDWTSHPPPEDRIPRTPEGLVLTHLTPSEESRHRGYVVVDCAGESFDVAFHRQHRQRELEGRGGRSYLTALGLAQAYVLVLEADDLVREAGARRQGGRSDAERLMMAFHDILGGILVAKERLRHQSPEDLLQQGISREELGDAFERRSRFRTPICIAFAQADRLAGLGAEPSGFDHDPYLFAHRHARFLYNVVERRFTHYRFDFVSAFPGYEKDDAVKPAPDYSLPSWGTAAVFDWIDGLLAPRPPLAGGLLRLASGGVPTRSAVRFRRLIDPAFRRELRNG